ncbi:MAG: hypothetical protein Q4A49_04330 [Neisseria sp.]|nr:hypothetical protein [Neisseria sp.]
MPSAPADGINTLPLPLPITTAAIAVRLISKPVYAANRSTKQKQQH